MADRPSADASRPTRHPGRSVAADRTRSCGLRRRLSRSARPASATPASSRVGPMYSRRPARWQRSGRPPRPAPPRVLLLRRWIPLWEWGASAASDECPRPLGERVCGTCPRPSQTGVAPVWLALTGNGLIGVATTGVALIGVVRSGVALTGVALTGVSRAGRPTTCCVRASSVWASRRVGTEGAAEPPSPAPSVTSRRTPRPPARLDRSIGRSAVDGGSPSIGSVRGSASTGASAAPAASRSVAATVSAGGSASTGSIGGSASAAAASGPPAVSLRATVSSVVGSGPADPRRIRASVGRRVVDGHLRLLPDRRHAPA